MRRFMTLFIGVAGGAGTPRGGPRGKKNPGAAKTNNNHTPNQK
jgi:hypothetical protein